MRYSEFDRNKPVISEGVDKAFKIPDHYPDIMPNLEKCGLRRSQVIDLFNREYKDHFKYYPKERFFMMFGIKVLNPLINTNLQRSSSHPTFQRLMEYSMKRFL